MMNGSHALLWIESLAVALLLSAALLACVARLRASGLRTLMTYPASLAALPGYAWIFWAFTRSVPSPLGGPDSRPLVALTVAFVASALVIRAYAFTGADRVRASSWPRGRLAATFGVAALLHVLTIQSIDNEIRSWLDRVHVEAGAMELAAAPPPLASHENAAWLYDEAIERIEELEIGRRLRDDVPGILGEATVDWSAPAVAAIVTEAESILTILREAASYPSYRVDGIGTPSWIASASPRILPLYDGLRLLLLECGLRIRSGDRVGAVSSLNAAYAMSRHVADLHMLIATMVSAGVEPRLAALLGDLLAMPELTGDELGGLAIDPSFSFLRSYVQALRLEEAGALARYAYAFSSSGAALYRIFVVPTELQTFRARMSCVHALHAQQWSGSVKNELDALLEESRHTGGMLGVAFGAIASRRGGMDVADAWRRASRIALAIGIAERESGARIATLEDLPTSASLPFVPRDPFGGGPFVVRADEHGWSVASAGPNGTNDGGSGDDLVIRVDLD